MSRDESMAFGLAMIGGAFGLGAGLAAGAAYDSAALGVGVALMTSIVAFIALVRMLA